MKEQNERKSLIGHIKFPVARHSSTIFATVTFAYLDLSDMVKLLQLSQETRQVMLSQNF